MKAATYELTQPGWVIVAAVIVLMTIGVGSIYVTDTHYVAAHDGPRNAAKQCIFTLAGLMLAAGVLGIGYQTIARHAYIIFILNVLVLLPLLIADSFNLEFGGLTKPINGAYRWYRLPGFQLQPSEFMKVAYLLALAWYLRYRKNYRNFSGLLVPLVVSAVPLVLILLEPDLGTVLLLLPVLFGMLLIAGAKVRHILILAMIALAAAPFAWWKIKDYQRLRVSAVLLQNDELRHAVIEQPDDYTFLATKRQAIEWAASSGYQLVHSKNAIGSGGLLGQGWGHGVYVEQNLLPDRHNDFVMAVVGHQWGLAGSVLVLACYAVMVLAGVRIASGTADPFARLLAVGVIILIATQVIINIGMSVGLMPITGMTLPFVSYGGSSLFTNFIAVALLISVSQRRPYLLANKPFEWARRRRRQPTELNDYEEGLPTLVGSTENAG